MYRIRDTYGYFGASIGITAATAAAVFRTPAALNLVASGGMISLAVSIAAMIGTGMVNKHFYIEILEGNPANAQDLTL